MWMTTEPTLESELIWDRDNVWEYVIYLPLLTTENVENNLDDHRANCRDWIVQKIVNIGKQWTTNNNDESREIADVFTTHLNDQPTLETELIWDRDNVWEYVIYFTLLTIENVEIDLNDHRANFRDWIDLGQR